MSADTVFHNINVEFLLYFSYPVDLCS